MTLKNQKALEAITKATAILEKLRKNPESVNYHDPILSNTGDSRHNGQYVREKVDEIYKIYNIWGSRIIINDEQIPQKVRSFVKEAENFLYWREN